MFLLINCYLGNKGYEKDQVNCVDINECANIVTNQCNTTCINSVGSYSCACSSGYRLSGPYNCVS